VSLAARACEIRAPAALVIWKMLGGRHSSHATRRRCPMANGTKLEVLLGGLKFGEGPRWHDGKLWFSDFYAHRVATVDLDGRDATIVEVPQRPSGLGRTLKGELLVV
jgi:sugar lactone lactonase YvrE